MPRASKKKKASIHEAITAIQKGMNAMADSGQASEKRGDFRVAMVEGGKSSKDVKSSGDKRFGDGPQWSKRGEENGGRSIIKHPNKDSDQIGLTVDTT